MKPWTTQNIPSLKDKTAIVTGVSGLGFEDSLALAKAGAKVILAGRSETKGKEALAAIQAEVKNADVSFELLDLADLSSVKAFSARIKKQLKSLDILINNAGIMTPPKRIVTKDGFELQFETNYLGHFVLTGQLLPLLVKAKGRVISLSSVAARNGSINFDNLNAQNTYVPMTAYAQSKLACLMFALELQKRSDENGWGILSIASHPGISRTNLFTNGDASKNAIAKMRTYASFLFQDPAKGALPTLFAATSPDAKATEYYGPNGIGQARGYPTNVRIPKQALNKTVAAQLWDVSEELSGFSYPIK